MSQGQVKNVIGQRTNLTAKIRIGNRLRIIVLKLQPWSPLATNISGRIVDFCCLAVV
jgi:hypothetical protein